MYLKHIILFVIKSFPFGLDFSFLHSSLIPLPFVLFCLFFPPGHVLDPLLSSLSLNAIILPKESILTFLNSPKVLYFLCASHVMLKFAQFKINCSAPEDELIASPSPDVFVYQVLIYT